MRERAPPLVPCPGSGREVAEPVAGAGAIVTGPDDVAVVLAFPAVALAGFCFFALLVNADGEGGCGDEEDEAEGRADGDAGDGATGEARGAAEGVFEGVELRGDDDVDPLGAFLGVAGWCSGGGCGGDDRDAGNGVAGGLAGDGGCEDGPAAANVSNALLFGMKGSLRRTASAAGRNVVFGAYAQCSPLFEIQGAATRLLVRASEPGVIEHAAVV